MKHYRILEKKGDKKEYIIQYTKTLFFGLFYWKKANKTIYYKYEDAFNEVKQLLKQSDYENNKYGYHYIDAYKIFRIKETPKQSEISKPIETPTTKTKSTFVHKGLKERKTNKSVFVPKK